MARYKLQDHNSLLLPVVLSEQIVPGSFAFALNYLVDHELDLKPLDAQFKNDEVGASAYDPRVMLKIVSLAYSQGPISSRAIAQACVRNVQFIAISGVKLPSNASKERSGSGTCTAWFTTLRSCRRRVWDTRGFSKGAIRARSRY